MIERRHHSLGIEPRVFRLVVLEGEDVDVAAFPVETFLRKAHADFLRANRTPVMIQSEHLLHPALTRRDSVQWRDDKEKAGRGRKSMRAMRTIMAALLIWLARGARRPRAAVLSDPAGDADPRLRRRRQRRRGVAHRRRRAEQAPRPAGGGRAAARRRRQHRLAAPRHIAAGRLHADHADRRPCGVGGDLQAAAVRSGRRASSSSRPTATRPSWSRCARTARSRPWRT